MAYITAEGKHTIYSEEESYAQSFIRLVNEELNDIKHSFFKIGFRLSEASQYKYYEELGYESIIELAEEKFGFKKTTTYGLMQVYRHCRSRDKNDSAFTIDKAYEDYNFSQLQEISRLRWAGGERLIRPSDNVTKIKHFVSVWNKDGECSDARGCETIDDYLRKTGRLAEEGNAALSTPILLKINEAQMKYEEEVFQKSGKIEEESRHGSELENSAYAENQAEIKSYAGQLPGQIGIEFSEPEEKENSAYAEKSIQQDVEEPSEPVYAPMSNEELIKECIKYGTGTEDFKFKLVEYYNRIPSPLQTEFVNFVKDAYGVGSCGMLEFDCKKITIHRRGGGKIVMPWTVVAGNISRLITANEYLTSDEKDRYLQWKAEKDGVKISIVSTEVPEPEKDVEVTHATRRQSNREHLMALSDEEFIDTLLCRILNIYPIKGEGAKFRSMLREPLKEWLNAPHEV